jgi:ATP-dependent RNA helicase HelY
MTILREYPVRLILAQLERDSLIPAILFRSARKQCDLDIEFLASGRTTKLSQVHQDKIERAVDAVLVKYQFMAEVIRAHPQYAALVQTGAGAHHAGQLLQWRLLLEELMAQGLLRLLIATGTVAAGVDFPARSVVITSHSKRGSEGFRVLLPSELQQMAGRAGRRGKDAVGLCLVAPSLFCDARVIHEVANRPPEPLSSAYFAAPSTVLNLLKFRNVDDLSYTVARSLAAFLDRKTAKGLREEVMSIYSQSGDGGESLKETQKKRIEKRARRLEREADQLEGRQLSQLRQSLVGLESLKFIENGNLTIKGLWAAELCTSLVLELAEIIEAGLVDGVTSEKLVAIVASLSADPHRQYFSIKRSPLGSSEVRKLEEIVAKVRAAYDSPLTVELKVVPDAATAAVEWMYSTSWDEFVSLITLAGAAPGDISRLISQTADHLNQIGRLHRTHVSLAETAIAARKLLLRPPLTDSLVADSLDLS